MSGFRSSDRCCRQTGGDGGASGGVDPAGGDQRADVLPLEEVVHLAGDSIRDQQLKPLRDENGRLKKVVAELTLDRAMLQDVLRKNW